MLISGIELRTAGKKGKGLFTNKLIPKGTIVWQYDPKENRVVNPQEIKTLTPKTRRLISEYKGQFIIGTTDLGDYINHSCNPNLVYSDDDTLIARSDIYPNEEITYDYATSDIDLINGELEEMICVCGEQNCRKIITPKDILRLDLQKRYKNHLPSWVRDFIQQNSK